jgi:hypothetical protein
MKDGMSSDLNSLSPERLTRHTALQSNLSAPAADFFRHFFIFHFNFILFP